MHALISHGVMTPAAPSKQGPAPLACLCLPPSLPSLHPEGALDDLVPLSSKSVRRYLSMPTRCILSIRGLTASREWWGDLSMQNTWLIDEVLRAS